MLIALVFNRGPLKRAQLTGIGMLVLTLGLMALPPLGDCRSAKQQHVVKPGDSVAKIADFYGVSQRDLRELNRLREGKPLRVGETLDIPHVLRVSGKEYRVREGDTLASIGTKFHRSTKALAHANKVSVDAPLAVGRTLVIPDLESSDKEIKVKGDGPAPVVFVRLVSGERETLPLYSKSGDMIYKSVQRLSYLARDKRGDHQMRRLHFRLVQMLQRVADKFPGKPIEIISGYRPNEEGNESQHAFGRALDFRMPGVSPKAIFRFCQTLPRSGCGYYPSTGFVHMDAREQSTTWIDRSRSRWGAKGR